MMSFCKKSVHSFLGLTIPINYTNTNNTILQDKPSKCLDGLGLGLITADSSKTPNILESASVKSSSCSLQGMKKDPGGIGFVDDVGGGVNGLMSCTESLGFESCDERRADEIEMGGLLSTRSDQVKRRKLAVGGRTNREVKKFPPPISSLNHYGQPSFFLRPVRKDGRLELTEVRIDRPEILGAHREDGRLRLHLITDDDDDEEEEEEEEEEKDIAEDEEKQELLVEDEEQEEEEENEEWRFPVNGDGFRRCNEVATHHHHHPNLHVWRQYCVKTS